MVGGEKKGGVEMERGREVRQGERSTKREKGNMISSLLLDSMRKAKTKRKRGKPVLKQSPSRPILLQSCRQRAFSGVKKINLQ